MAKLAAGLSLIGVFLYFLSIPAFLPEGSGNIRVVETLADYTKSHPEIGDAVDGFTRLYRTHSGKLEADGSVSYLFFETEMFCSARPYENLNALAGYIRPALNERPTSDDALEMLKRLNVRADDPAGYACILPNGARQLPGPTEIVGWEHTLRAKIIGNSQHFGIMLLVDAVLAFIVLNLYYRRKLPGTVHSS